MKKIKMLFPLLVMSFALTACGTTTSLTTSSSSSTEETTSENNDSKETTSEVSSEKESSETSSVEIVDVDTFDVIAAGLVAEDGKAYFDISGHYNVNLTINNPKIYVRNGDDGASTFSQVITCDASTGIYSAKVDLTNMTDGSWHDVKIYLDENADATGEVEKAMLPDGVYDQTINIAYPGNDAITKKYGFAEWDGYLKIYVECIDQLETRLTDMQYIVKDDGVYFQLEGVNSHKDGKLILKDGDTVYEYADTESEFVYDDSHNFVATVNVTDILKDGGKFDIRFAYTDSVDQSQEFEATNTTLSEEPAMQGVSYNGVNYVFRVDTWNENRYYKLASNTDKFSVDTIQLSSVDNKVNLHLQGVINTEASTDDLNLALAGSDWSIKSSDYTLNAGNYYIADFDVTDVPLYSNISEVDNKGAIQLRNGTESLNSIWTSDWSHRNDIVEVATTDFDYLLEGVHWGELALKKTSLN